MNLYRYLPNSATVTLLLFVLVYGAMPMIFAWHGFAYMLGTVLLAVGIQPHVKRVAAEGLRIELGRHWRGQYFGTKFVIHFRSETMVRILVSTVMMALALLAVPLVGFALQQQGVMLLHQLQTQAPAIQASANVALHWLQNLLPGIIPSGDLQTILGGVKGEVAGNAKPIFIGIAGFGLRFTSSVLETWFLAAISAILINVILHHWNEEVAQFRKIVSHGIVHESLQQNVLRFLELYQDGLSLLMIGFLQVFLILSVLYGLCLSILPFDLSVGGVVLFALVLGLITAVWKIGGLIAMAVGAVLMLLFNFEPGLSWFGFCHFSLNLYVDMAIKVIMITAVAETLGLLESYNFTPSVIGKMLGLTMIEMIGTILIWVLGAGFFGMIWGVLLMLLFQASMRLSRELEARPQVAMFQHRPPTAL